MKAKTSVKRKVNRGMSYQLKKDDLVRTLASPFFSNVCALHLPYLEGCACGFPWSLAVRGKQH